MRLANLSPQISAFPSDDRQRSRLLDVWRHLARPADEVLRELCPEAER